MPWAPMGVCRWVGCGRLTNGRTYGGFCEEHHQQRQRTYREERRAKADPDERFYHTAAWQRLRAAVLSEQPLCVHCDARGLTVVAVVVDHIQPVKQGGAVWDRANLQPLCNLCHEQKSVAEGSRFRPQKAATAGRR